MGILCDRLCIFYLRVVWSGCVYVGNGLDEVASEFCVLGYSFLICELCSDAVDEILRGFSRFGN